MRKGSVLVRRQFFLIFVPLALLVMLTAGTIAFLLIENALDRRMAEDRSLVHMSASELLGDLKPSLPHILSLPTEAAVRAAVAVPNPENLSAMATNFVTLLQRNPAYDRVRWIDQSGKERIRVDRNDHGDKPVIVPAAERRDRSSRSYFGDAIHLRIGEIFISGLDLGAGNGTRGMPRRPVIRVATPIAGPDGHRQGILVINILMTPSLESFIRWGQGQVMLLNRRGEWLYGPDAGDHWGTMIDPSVTIGNRFPAAWTRIRRAESGQFLDRSGLWSWDTVTAANLGLPAARRTPEPHWLVLSHHPAAMVRTVIADILQPTVLLTLSLLIVFAAMSWHIALRSKLRLDALAAKSKAEAEAEAHQQQILVLEESEKRLAILAAIVASSDDAIISKTLDGVITSWNPGAEKLFGYTAEEAIGQAMLLLFPPGKEQEEQQILERIGRGESVRHFQTRRRHKDGTLLDVSVTISPIHDAAGRVIGASKVARDITEIRRAHEELQRHRDHLEEMVEARTAQIREANEELQKQKKFITTITDNLPGMVGYWDRTLHCRFANSAYLRWFGRSTDDVIGIALEDLAGAHLPRVNMPRIRDVLTGIPQDFEQERAGPAGEPGYSQVHYIPDIKDGTVIGFFVLVTDVTAIKQAEIKLREANEQLEVALVETKAADLAKSRFLANMSHEIRTPMNAVLGFLSLVLEGELSGVTRRQLTTAYNSAKSLLLLINDILDISKLQSGKIDLENIAFNFPVILNSTLDMLQIRARDKKLDIQFRYSSDLPRCFKGDPMRIRQIVTNLVGNAIKFTDAGSVTLSVKDADTPGMVELSIADTGIGMTEPQVERIFTPFVQADSSTTRRFGGTGLGVSICKQLTEAMGGRIWVESHPGRGSTFHVVLPLRPMPDETEIADRRFADETPVGSTRCFRVLLVDDIEENIELGKARLAARGHQVTVARNGREAVALANRIAFDVILMDVHMPEMNGLDATWEIRRNQRTTDDPVPIIAMTASVLPSEQQRCFAAGMNAFIGKPIDFEQMFQLMEATVPLDRGQAADGAITPPSPGPDPRDLPHLNGIDLVQGVRRWADFARYTDALVKFNARYGDVAGRLAALHARGDWKGAHELAHALKGVAGNLVLSDVARVATALDAAFKARRDDGIRVLLADLAAACDVAAASVSLLARDLGEPLAAPPATPDEPAGAALPPASLAELLTALDSDDPGIMEPVLERLSASLPADQAVRLRELIGDFEFEQARILVGQLHDMAVNAP